MSRNLVVLLGLVATMPLAVEIPMRRDTTAAERGETRLRVAGGYGYYAFIARGCEGKVIDDVPVHARDGAVGVDHKFAKLPIRIGVRGGWTRDEIGYGADTLRFPEVPQGRTLTNRYVNPFIALDQRDGGLSIGYVFHDSDFLTADANARDRTDHTTNDVSFHMRLGQLDRKYFQVSWMEGMPIYSDGGYFTIGMGGQLPARRLQGFAGLGAGGPMEGAGPILRGSYALHPDVRVQVMLHGNMSGAGTAGVGLEYRIRH